MISFDKVFSKTGIYDMFFFNVKPVLQYPTLRYLEENDPVLYESWKHISKYTYGCEIHNMEHQRKYDDIYIEHAIKYAEFSKILVISYASLYLEDGEIKRYFKNIVNLDEKLVLITFMDILNGLSQLSDVPILCGYDINKVDIPFLIKRHMIVNGDESPEISAIPLILLKSLSKGTIDVKEMWKFNGINDISLTLIANSLKLKKTVEILEPNELSIDYWRKEADNYPKEALEFVGLQSAMQTNLIIQMMKKLRLL